MALNNYIQFRCCISDLLDTEVVKEMSSFIQHGNTTTLEHCILVSYLSFRICKLTGLNYYAAARGALLHDLYLYDWHDLKIDIKNFREILKLHGFTHPKKALDNANSHFELSVMEMDIIHRHMFPLTPIPPSYLEGFVVCAMDKVAALMEMTGICGFFAVKRIINLNRVRETLVREIIDSRNV